MDAVEMLRGLVAQYSPTGQEDAAAEYLQNVMSASGYSAKRDAVGNVVGSIGQGSKEIMLLGHIDTVPGQIEMHQEGNLFFGRGTVDAKGPLACFTAAAANAQVGDGWKLTVIGAVGEEGDSRGARYLCKHYNAPAMVIIGEPSSWERITLGYKGSAWGDYTISRPLEHSAAQGKNACELAVDFWNRLVHETNKINAATARTFDQVSPTLRQIRSWDDGFNMTASLQISLRLPPAWDHKQLNALLDGCWEEGDLQIIDFTPAYLADKNSSLVRAFLPAIRSAGGKPSFCLKSGTSDMNLVAPLWQCPALAYGPGDSSLDHTPNEHIDLAEFLRSIQVLTKALNHLMDQTANLSGQAKHSDKQSKPPQTVW